jgi:predicted PolB exonuclease-like 3'-5' exonuclease
VLKRVTNCVWAFDIEWVPDPLAGRLLYDIPDGVTDPAQIMQRMWSEGRSDEDDPRPFLRMMLCRVVSIAALERRVRSDGEVVLNLMSLPRDVDDPEQASEAGVIGTFLDAVGDHRPQLVGYNSIAADLKILVQRGTLLGLRAAGFGERPEKPWEGVDYFARGGDFHVDLRDILSGFGGAAARLHELAVQSGIPGKLDVEGGQVAMLWLEGELRRIVQYNEYDALTTYLLWLRVAHFAGHFTDEEYIREQARVGELLERESSKPEGAHLERYLREWERLRALIESERAV